MTPKSKHSAHRLAAEERGTKPQKDTPMETIDATPTAAAQTSSAGSELADLIERHPDLGIDPALLTPGQNLILIYCPSTEAVA